jgi:uncharacterized protein DUF1761
VDITKVNWLAVVVAAIAPFVIGSLWYGPLFMKPWSALTGIKPGTPRQNSMALTFGITYLFESRPLKLWLINAGYQTVVFTIMGAILGAWH